jgi:hypothetical protein
MRHQLSFSIIKVLLWSRLEPHALEHQTRTVSIDIYCIIIEDQRVTKKSVSGLYLCYEYKGTETFGVNHTEGDHIQIGVPGRSIHCLRHSSGLLHDVSKLRLRYPEQYLTPGSMNI